MADGPPNHSQSQRTRQRPTQEQIEARRRRNRERAAARRRGMTEEERESERARQRERARRRRANERNREQERRAAEERRVSQSADEVNRRRVIDRQARQATRNEEEEEDRNVRLQRTRDEMRAIRELENTPERGNRRERDRQRTNASRELERTPETQDRLRVMREARREQRDLEDTPLREERRESVRNATRISRSQENPQERAARQSSDRQRRIEIREREEPVQRTERREQDRVTTSARRRLFPVESSSYLHIGSMDVPCTFCGALHFKEERTVRSPASNPQFSECCGNGKVSFAPLPNPPALLRELLTGSTPRDRAFRRNIRAYNSTLSMGSVTANWIARGPGTSTFNPTMTLQGQIYHYLGALVPPQGRSPAFLSVYIHDTDYTEQSRLRTRPELSQDLLEELSEMLHQVNPYVQTFRSLREWATTTETEPAPYRMVIHSDRRPRDAHIGRYNGPASSEVAAIVPGSEDGEVGRRDIVLRRRGSLNSAGNEVLDTVSVTHRSYDPLCYVLIFPDGRDGWHPELRFTPREGARRSKVTPNIWYSWQLFERPSQFSILLRSARLFQQYLVDQFCKQEAEKMWYLRANQERLRASDYTNLREMLGDSGRMQDEASVVRAGRLFILPSTHIGGDRYMRQQMHDIIAISNKLGHPDIFLTMTCNPKWPEITSALLPEQLAQDRPDLAARVFRIKMRALMSYVIDQRLFGTVVAHVRVIEFQKRGLPHAHCIFFLDRTSTDNLRRPEHIDSVISAEIPPSTDNELREIVLRNAIHNPCGEINPNAVCMSDRGCRKRFPKDFQRETGQSNSEYYVTYRRRSPADGGERVERSTRIGGRSVMVEVDNSWVVPYSPQLSRMFACHINVELCISRVGGIKYLFKYICKGSDRVSVELIGDNQRYDEISSFQDARYVSASEAVWRLLGFDIVDRSPPVYRLDVHLEGHHTVYFAEEDALAAAARERPGTKMTEWFAANMKYPGARHISYDDFPKYFTWNNGAKKWNPRAILRVGRRRGSASSSTATPQEYDFSGNGAHVVSRIYTVSPREGERYFLRMLLLQVKGATSFRDIRTVDGEECQSFREACNRLGLLAEDTEWARALQDSFRSRFVPLSQVFATILAYCEPSSPIHLWEEHRDIFITDIRQRLRRHRDALRVDADALSHVLREVQEHLSTMCDSTLSDFGLPIPPSDLPVLQEHETEQDMAQIQQEVASSIAKFNQGQRAVFNEVVGAVLPGTSCDNLDGASSSAAPPECPSSASQRVFFLDAPGGTGKTFVTGTIQAFLKTRGKNVMPVATSAVAAQLLSGGRTAHSTFKIPIPCLADSTCHISANGQLAAELRAVDLIIWDEIVMCHRFCVEAVDRSLQDITGTSLPFGGKCVLLSGDFRQILPVIPGGSQGQIVSACIRFSSLYSCLKTLRLSENMRLTALREDPNADSQALQFPSYLLQVGEGRVVEAQGDRVGLPPSIETSESIRLICYRVFQGIQENHGNDEWLTGRAVLTTKNVNLDPINAIVGAMLPGEYRTYLSADKVENEDQNALRYPVEMLNTLTAGSALPDHKLRLKKGVVIMLLRNLDPLNGHVNGARYILENMTNNVLFARLAVGSHVGGRIALPRIPCSPGDDNFPVPGFTRTQFPVRVCFALTTNKAQGQSFNGCLGLDLRDECFSHGQLYVALSRTTHPSNVIVCTNAGDRRTKNVVYREVFS